MIEDAVEMTRLLVISRDLGVLDVLRLAAEPNRWLVEKAADAWDAIDKVHSGTVPDLLVLDMPSDPGDGLQILRTLRRIYPALPLVLIGHAGDHGREQEALRMGARDYLHRPLSDRQLEMAIRHNLSAKHDEARAAASAGLQDENGQVSSAHEPREGICGHKSLRSLLQSVKEETEKNAIALALEETGWNRKAAARLLKTSYRTVLYKIEQYQMSSSDFSASSARNGPEAGHAGSSGNGYSDIPPSDIPRVDRGGLNERSSHRPTRSIS